MSDTPSGRPRRAFMPDDADADSGRSWVKTDSADQPSTPVPPPTPALPVTESYTPRRGRRFADTPAVEGDPPLPRRSAVSPDADFLEAVSPASPPRRARRFAEPLSPTSPTETAALSTADASDHDQTADKKSFSLPTFLKGRRAAWIGGIALLLIGALVLGIAFLSGGNRRHVPAPAPEHETDSYLPTVEELSSIRPGTTWKIQDTFLKITGTMPTPTCLLTAADMQTKARSSAVRTYIAEGAALGAKPIVVEIDTYDNPEDAERAFSERSVQLGNCAGSTALLGRGYEVSGLGDQQIGIQAVYQQAANDVHEVFVVRTGTKITVIDAYGSGDASLDPTAVARALVEPLKRQCAENGSCPGDVSTKIALPPAGVPAGWLTVGDFPRITPGSGTWGGTSIDPMKISGSQCEAIDLTNPAGATSKAQRTYLLTNDPKAPGTFGVDQVVYTFGKPEDASGLVTKIADNINGCTKRALTSTVKKTGDINAGGAVGQTFAISQKTNDGTLHYRVAIVANGSRATYLLANPSDGFDMSDGAFNALATRAGQRLSQAA